LFYVLFSIDRTLLFARPQVLSVARVRENWFFGLTKHSAIFTEQGWNVNRQFLQILAGLQSLIGRGRGQLPNVEPVESLSRESVEAGGQVSYILSLDTRLQAVGAGGQVSYIWLGKRANPLSF
jgi:hypothetical protein